MAGIKSVGGNPAAPPYSNGPYTWDEDVTLHQQSLPYRRAELIERFNRLPQLNASIAISTNIDFEILGTNASNDDVTFASTVGGIFCETDGASGDQVIVLPHLDTAQSAWAGFKWGTENQVIWEAVIRTGASVASTIIWAGLKLTNTSVVATDDDGAYFRYDGTPANWTAVTSIGGTDVETDLGSTYAAVAADTNYYLKIAIDSDRKAHFYINNRELYVSSALTNDVDLIPYIGVQAATAAAKSIYIVSTKISRIIFE